MRRNSGGYEVERFETESLKNLLRRVQVAVVNGVESAAEEGNHDERLWNVCLENV